VAADGYAPNDLLNNAAITGELLMGTGKSFPGSANKMLED
jgi:3-oxoacyl-[acyl-carrier protein] reductase